MGHIPDKVEEFHRRTLSKRGEEVKVVEMFTYIDGSKFSHQGSSKAVSMLFVSRPDEEGFTLEIAERGVAPYTEFTHPGSTSAKPHPWQSDASGPRDEGVFRRSYPIEGDALDEAKRIEVVIKINGDTWMHMEAREPGVMGFVADWDGFAIHVVGANSGSYVDRRGPGDDHLPLYSWQAEALGLK